MECEFCIEEPLQSFGSTGTASRTVAVYYARSKVRVLSHRIRDLKVSDYHREHIVKLPMMFESDAIPSNRSQISKPEVATEWEHLRVLADQMMPYNPGIEVSMLIANNGPKIVRPREVTVRSEGEPYGQRSLLGWEIIGNVFQSSDEDNEIQDAYCN